LFQLSPTGVLIEDKNGMILDANPALHHSFGYEEGKIIGKNIKLLAHPDMYKNIDENIKTLLSGISLNHIVKGRKADGSMIYNELYETRIFLSHIGDAVLCISNDITNQINSEHKLKENAKHYRTLFYNNPLPMYIFKKDDYSFLDVNQAAINKYGYSRAELSKMTILDIRPKEDVNLVINDIAKLRTGLERRGIWRHQKKSGEIIYVEITANSIEYFGRKGELILANDVTKRIKAQTELEKSQNQIREFADHLETIREEERSSIAREIHDNLGQALTAIKMDLSWISNNYKKSEKVIQTKISSSKELINSSIKTIQKISTALRPGIIDDLGLIASLEWFIDDFKYRNEISCSFDYSPPHIKLTNDLSVNIFRIVQEALTNVTRHANATNVLINISIKKDILNLSISDDGIGITHAQKKRHNSFGIIGIKERVIKFNGSIKISGTKNKGTKIQINIPLTDRDI